MVPQVVESNSFRMPQIKDKYHFRKSIHLYLSIVKVGKQNNALTGYPQVTKYNRGVQGPAELFSCNMIILQEPINHPPDVFSSLIIFPNSLLDDSFFVFQEIFLRE